MSGLCGWFGPARNNDPAGAIERMLRALPNHGHLETKTACGTNFGLALHSHRATGDFAATPELVVAIEGYPRWSSDSLGRIAQAEGHARALMSVYRQKGPALFSEVRGPFSCAVLDLAAEKALLAIDRFGVQTLAYAEPHPGLIVFGSTTDAVRAHPETKATIRLQSIFDYLYFVDRIVAPATIYEEQRRLAPAEYLLATPARTMVGSYWQMPYRSAAPIGKVAAAEELMAQLADAVKISLRGEDDGRVGAFLSGGLDSSSVVGIAAGLLPGKLQSFTIGFPVEGFDEARYAEIAAKRFGSKHQIYYVQPHDVLDVLRKSVEIYDEPFANSSFIPAYYCARLAAESGVEMMLAGDGGDELFAGNKQYAEDAVFDLYTKLPAFVRRAILKPLSLRLAFARDIKLLGKPIRYVERAEQSVTERLADNIFRNRKPSEILSTEVLRAIDPASPRTLAERLFEAPADASKVQRMMHVDLRVLLASSDLPKVVRMCEIAGLRARFPFLTEEVAEFSAGLPETLLLEGGRLRQFYKDAMHGFLPDAIIRKQKHGFGLPYLAFMNSYPKLRDIICDSLTNLKRRSFFEPSFLEGLKYSTLNGDLMGDEAVAWDLMVLEFWLDSHT